MSADVIAISFIFLLAGIAHFAYPKPFLYVMPAWVPYPQMTNYFVGVVEISLGVSFLIDSYRSIIAWLIILLLIAVFPANINHFMLSRRANKHVFWTALRLPLQFGLIYWIWQYA